MYSGFRDYMLTIDGTLVAVGDKEFIADLLGIKVGSIRRWLHDEKHREWGAVDALPNEWKVNGVSYTTDEACALLGCDRRKLSSFAFYEKHGVQRSRYKNWSVPQEAIDKMLESHRRNEANGE